MGKVQSTNTSFSVQVTILNATEFHVPACNKVKMTCKGWKMVPWRLCPPAAFSSFQFHVPTRVIYSTKLCGLTNDNRDRPNFVYVFVFGPETADLPVSGLFRIRFFRFWDIFVFGLVSFSVYCAFRHIRNCNKYSYPANRPESFVCIR